MAHILLWGSRGRPLDGWKDEIRGVDGVTAVHYVVETKAALALLASEPITLVVLDPVDDDGSVRTLVRREVSDSVAASPRLLHVVAPGDHLAVERSFAAGADDIVELPGAPAILRARVAGVMQRQLAEARVRELSATGERLAQRRTGLLNSVVHDLRNPAAVLRTNLAWMAECLRAGSLDLGDAIDDCLAETQHIGALLNDLATIAQLESSPSMRPTERIGLHQLLEEVVAAQADNARGRRVSLAVTRGDELGIDGDREVLKRAVDNLVERALRSTPPAGHVHLSARQHGGASGIEIAVSNGAIDEAEQRPSGSSSALSERPSVPSHDPLPGLGVYFCQRAAEAHRGDLELYESGPAPTVLLLRLPAA